MASTTNTLILSLKILLISAGALSIASGLRFSVPLLLDFSVSQAPSLWSSFRSWLRPPYLYAIINGIIIIIAASSRFHHRKYDGEDFPRTAADPRTTLQYQSRSASTFDVVVYEQKWTEATAEVEDEVFEGEEEKNVVAEYGGREAEVSDEEDKNLMIEDEEEIATMISLKRIGYSPDVPSLAANPLVSPRFGHQKPVESSPQAGGRLLRVAKLKEHETMENTWNMIMEGREAGLTRQKTDMWENQGREIVVCECKPAGRPPAKKSETFKDRTNYNQQPPVPASLRKEPSLGQDELNRRVEEFIKKFNEDMRLQRQESLNLSMDMINRGTN